MDKITKLTKQQKKIIKQMPDLKKILRTTVSKYYLTCGYKKCRCHSGEKKHGPFVYLSFTDKGKTKMYFTPKDIEKYVKEGVKNYNRLWKDIYKLCKINREILWMKKNWGKEDVL